MVRLQYDTYDTGDDRRDKVLLEWGGEDGDIYQMVERFRYFLLAMSFPPSLVNRVVYLDNSQAAKLKLSGEDYEE